MPRRVHFIAFLGVTTMLVFATGFSAAAAPGADDIRSTKAEIAAAQERLTEIRMEAGAAHAEYDNALFRMNELNVKIEEAEAVLEATEEQLAEAQKDMDEHASRAYKSGNVTFINVLVGTDKFSQFANRLDLWMRLLGEERAEFEAVLEAKKGLEARKSALETERARRAEAVEEALAHKQRAAEAEAEAEAYLDSLNGELQAAIEAEQERQARLAQEAAAKAAEEAPEPEPVAERAPQPDPAAQQETTEAERRAQLAEERAAVAEQWAAEPTAEEEAEEQADIEAAAAEQAKAEERVAELAVERAAAAEQTGSLEKATASPSASASAAPEDASATASPSASASAASEDTSASAASEDASASASPSAPASVSGGGVGSGTASAVVAEAQTHMGTPYEFSPPEPCEINVGEDCSCHTMLVFAEFGISLPDSPEGQVGYGTPVEGEPAAGDLLFWSEDGSGIITHVGIATGNGTTIHASSYEGFVTETPIDLIPGYVGAERLF
jgi:peptidoglycan DL-endopeptidase RipA